MTAARRARTSTAPTRPRKSGKDAGEGCGDARSKAHPAGKSDDVVPARRRRLSPEQREREIVEGAIAFFAEVGFDGGLRDLAKRLGITHQNLFRYFATKEALIERVYKEVYLNRWRREWEDVLSDDRMPLEKRLLAFYGAYFPAIYRYDWVRIFVYAGLKDVGITRRYLDHIRRMVVEPLARELRRTSGLKDNARTLRAEELEIAWGLHGELFYLAIRKWVYGMAGPDDVDEAVRLAIVRFMKGAPAAMRAVAREPSPS